jgi:hypothetical protein
MCVLNIGKGKLCKREKKIQNSSGLRPKRPTLSLERRERMGRFGLGPLAFYVMSSVS